jgi:hypothetical protein
MDQSPKPNALSKLRLLPKHRHIGVIGRENVVEIARTTRSGHSSIHINKNGQYIWIDRALLTKKKPTGTAILLIFYSGRLSPYGGCF